MEIKIKKSDLRDFKNMVRNSGIIIKQRGKQTLEEILTEQEKSIERNPWDVGEEGGGVPVDSGKLKRDHRYYMRGHDKAKVEVDNSYAQYVHGGTRHMAARPWLDDAMEDSEREVDKETKLMLKKITQDLAK